jgi:hypothetical protein
MNNSCYGKTMEDVRNRVNVKLVTKKKDMNNLSRKSNFDRVNIFSENLTAAHMRKTCVKLNNPIYLGQAVLDLSKTLMYEFHYDYIKPKYNWNAQYCCLQTLTVYATK